MSRRRAALALFFLAAGFAGAAAAQTTRGYGTDIRVPVGASTGTNVTTLFVHNPSVSASTIRISYYGATGTFQPGFRSCGDRVLQPGETLSGNLATICTLGAGSNFGQIRLQSIDADDKPFAAYTRVQQFSGDGFSIEGFPIGAFSNPQGSNSVIGLRRQAAAPGYASNCFIGSTGEQVSVTFGLYSSSGTLIGALQNYTVAANDLLRLLDVFAAVGAPAGDYSNVRATFLEDGPGEPAFIGFCTTQNNTTFDSDFRIAKDHVPEDMRNLYDTVADFDGLGGALSVNAAEKDVFGVYFQHPDTVSCSVTGANAANLELLLRTPDGNVLAGGNGINGFTNVYLGDKSTVFNGVNGLWRLEVGVAETGGLTPPYAYGLTCSSGNGANPPLFIGTLVDDF